MMPIKSTQVKMRNTTHMYIIIWSDYYIYTSPIYYMPASIEQYNRIRMVGIYVFDYTCISASVAAIGSSRHRNLLPLYLHTLADIRHEYIWLHIHSKPTIAWQMSIETVFAPAAYYTSHFVLLLNSMRVWCESRIVCVCVCVPSIK